MIAYLKDPDMRNGLVHLAIIAIAIIAYSCSEGSTIGVVNTDDNDSTIFDFPDGKRPPTTGFFFYGKVDGHYHCLIEDTANYTNVADSNRIDNCTDSTFLDEQRTRIFRPGDNRNIFQFRLYQCLLDTTDSVLFKVAGYDTTWEARSYPFIEPFDPYVGVDVLWTDSKGNAYRSIPGSGNPQNSYFQINSIERNQTDTLSFSIVEGTYVGTLFNFDQSESVFITESKFRLRFIQIPDTIYKDL